MTKIKFLKIISNNKYSHSGSLNDILDQTCYLHDKCRCYILFLLLNNKITGFTKGFLEFFILFIMHSWLYS